MFPHETGDCNGSDCPVPAVMGIHPCRDPIFADYITLNELALPGFKGFIPVSLSNDIFSRGILGKYNLIFGHTIHDNIPSQVPVIKYLTGVI
jgi:hypothetical protein